MNGEVATSAEDRTALVKMLEGEDVDLSLVFNNWDPNKQRQTLEESLVNGVGMSWHGAVEFADESAVSDPDDRRKLLAFIIYVLDPARVTIVLGAGNAKLEPHAPDAPDDSDRPDPPPRRPPLPPGRPSKSDHVDLLPPSPRRMRKEDYGV
jgi:hypothetical protein